MEKPMTMARNEIRLLEPGDAPVHRRLMAHAFDRGRVVRPADEDEAAASYIANKWGLFDENGALQAALTIRPFEVHWGPSTVLALGGLAGVATWAHARGQGHGDALLKKSLEAMRDAGQTISALYPFAWNFYRRYGWDWVGRRFQVTLPLRELSRTPAQEAPVVAFAAGEAGATVDALLRGAYEAFARNYRGVFTGASHQWDRLGRPGDERTTYTYAVPPDGYLLWRFPSSGDTGEVSEFVANSPHAWGRLLSLLYDLRSQARTARLALPADTPLWSHVMHWDLETKTVPVFMGRVVDLAGALGHLAPALSLGPDDNASATLSVRDEHAPWNTGTWRLSVENGRVVCARAPAALADVSLDIQALSQAFWGAPSLAELRRVGQIEVTGERGWAVLNRLLPAFPVYTMDHF